MKNFFELTDETPLGMLTVGQFKELMKPYEPKDIELPEEIKYVYGLKGIRELFGVCHAKAHQLKETVIKEAVMQNGRKIVVDVNKALELFNEKNN